jgi:hypothetical protein
VSPRWRRSTGIVVPDVDVRVFIDSAVGTLLMFSCDPVNDALLAAEREVVDVSRAPTSDTDDARLVEVKLGTRRLAGVLCDFVNLPTRSEAFTSDLCVGLHVDQSSMLADHHASRCAINRVHLLHK